MLAIIMALCASAVVGALIGIHAVKLKVPKVVQITTGFAFGDKVWPGTAKIVEESGEVLQVIGKLMMTHGHPDHWSGNLVDKLNEEIADLVAATEVFCTLNKERLNRPALVERANRKIDHFMGWHTEASKND